MTSKYIARDEYHVEIVKMIHNFIMLITDPPFDTLDRIEAHITVGTTVFTFNVHASSDNRIPLKNMRLSTDDWSAKSVNSKVMKWADWQIEGNIEMFERDMLWLKMQ